MKINVSSKSISIGIFSLIFLAIGILTIAFIGKGSNENMLSFDDYSVMEYSEHSGWTDISVDADGENEISDFSDGSSTNISEKDLLTLIEDINEKYECEGSVTEEMFSDEMGLKITQLSFLDKFTPENVSYSLGYVFAGEKVFDIFGNDLSDVLEGYSFVGGRDDDGNVLFKKEGKYFYIQNGMISESHKVDDIKFGPSYFYTEDEEPEPFKSDDKWGAIDKNEKIIVKALYSNSHGFYNGIGCFSTQANVLYFYTNDGKLISSGYKKPKSGQGALRFFDGITLVSDGKKNLILKSSGSILDIPVDYNIKGCSDGIILLEKDGMSGYMNSKGQWITTPKFESLSYFTEGLAVVSDEVPLIIDRTGNTIIPKGFDYISDFSNGRCLMFSEKNGWYVATKCFNKK